MHLILLVYSQFQVLQGNNVNELMEGLINALPEGPQYYPADQITDHPERFLVSEMIREKVLQLTREEIPTHPLRLSLMR